MIHCVNTLLFLVALSLTNDRFITSLVDANGHEIRYARLTVYNLVNGCHQCWRASLEDTRVSFSEHRNCVRKLLYLHLCEFRFIQLSALRYVSEQP